MCVIVLAETTRLLDTQVEMMWDANSKGGGIAWREEVGGALKVKWEKGLSKAEMVEANQTLPFPYILHFRLPSTGTSTSVLAAHPFQVDEDATTGFDGMTDGYVLFHNGFWIDWKKKMQDIAIAGCVRVPSGPWSDSRGLAWAAHHLGLGFLDLVDEKVAIIGPQYIELFGSWLTMAVKEGEDGTVLVTNKAWDRPSWPTNNRQERTSETLALAHRAIHAKTEEPGGASHQSSFRPGIGRVGPESAAKGDQPKSVQEATQGPQTAILDHTLTKCTKCGKHTSAGVMRNGGPFRCYQCDADHLAKPRVGFCSMCKVSKAGCKTYDGDRWICIACWETNQKPRVYFGHEREVRG